MIFLCCLKNRNKFYNLLITSAKDTKMLNFRLKLKKIINFLLSMSRFVEKKINLQQLFPEKIRSVVYILILVVLQHLNTNLAQCTHFYIQISQIVSDFSKFHFEVETFKKTLHKNACPTKFFDKYIAKVVNNICVQKPRKHRSKIGTQNGFVIFRE